MAHHSKFASVNLNRSYGQPSSSSASSPSAHDRSRPGSGGGGSGGMVVLSRARGSASSVAKTAQKLAVPPPMNLPSLRKEHERFDPASSASAAGHGSPALGARASSSALGWSKPALPPPSSIAEKDAGSRGQSQLGRPAISGDELAGTHYMLPGARPGGLPLNAMPGQGFSEKAVILRGEDFPSLGATFTSVPKQREASSQKQRQKQGMEELLVRREKVSESHAPLQMRPQIKSSRLITSNVLDGNGGSIQPLGSSEQSQKQDGHLRGMLPLIQFQHTSDWTDDERDTGLSIPERERDWGFSRSESVQVHDSYDSRGLRDTEVGRSREFFNGGSFGRDVKAAASESQDFSSWRFPLNPRDRLNTNALGADRGRHCARPLSGSKEMNMEGANGQSYFFENGSHGFAKRSQDSRCARVNLGSPDDTRIDRSVSEAFSGNGAEQNVHGHYNDYSNNWSKGSSFQNTMVSKVQLSTRSKGTSLNDSKLNIGREKRLASSAGKPFVEDAEFDIKDTFSGGIGDMNLKVFKKKKDLEKQVDFPDPIRESFEAEIERIQRMQEQERQREMEERARIEELKQKEEEERERLAREDEERRRLLEEEAREAAWRAEQERLEAMRRAEEQRIEREEEKRRYEIEEERRKEAAKQKLLELEARIARRQAEDKGTEDRVPSSVHASDELVPRVVKERDIPRVAEVGSWEDSERMVERITSYAFSEDSMVDDFSTFTRYHQVLRPSCVPPHPYVTSVQRSSYRDFAERASSSCFVDDDAHHNHQSIYEQRSLQTGYDNMFHETHHQHGTTAFLEENAILSEQEQEKMSLRCDSQLSLSVSSPPSSPDRLSHHEMDISRDSTPLPTSADGKRTVVSDSEHLVLPLEGGTVDRMMNSGLVSPGVDDDWPVENNEEIQDQEEYYEEVDDYQDIPETQEGDDENPDPALEIEDLQTDMQASSGEVEQVILGFNEGVEVKLPSIGKFEITSSNSKKGFKAHAGSAEKVEESIINGEINLQEGIMDNSLTIVSEAEKALQDLSLDRIAASSYSTNSVETSQSSVVPAQHTMFAATSLSMASTDSDSPILSLPSTVVGQGEAPISLQFGLFSGPSLIPSPVPAIQIGSIQMPIHVHTQICPSLPQVHSSQPPLFQFGQLRYTPTFSQSIFPLASHSTSFVQPPAPAPAPYSFNQNPAGCLCNQASQNSLNKLRDEKPAGSSVKQPDLVQTIAETSSGHLPSGQLKVLLDPGKNISVASQSQTDITFLGERKGRNDSISQAERHGGDDATAKKSYRQIGKRKESQAQQHAELQSSRFLLGGKRPVRIPGTLSGGRRKRFTYSVKNTGSRSSFPGVDILQADSSGFQRRARRNIRRTGFGVRENTERKQTQGLELFNNTTHCEKPNENSVTVGVSIGNLGKKDANFNRSTKIKESENLNSGASVSRVVSSDRKTEKAIGNEINFKNTTNFDKSHGGKGNLKTSDILEEDVDAPLLSGVVRVFKQTGIEVPSNEDDFIEVRSKRQMLNDRREQRAKENKSKSRVPKAPSKQTAAIQSNAANSNSNKAAISSVGETPNIVCSDPLVGEGKGSTGLEASVIFTAKLMSQTLPPIGTPSVNADPQRRLNDLKSSQVIAVSDSGPMLVPGLLENKNSTPDYSVLPLSTWDSANMSHQVIALTQTQLDEAMKPAQFGSQAASSMVLEPHKPASSVMTTENPFSSCSCPVSSLLAGEKIQFGAVMPPNILPPVGRAISKGLGPPDLSRSELKIGQNPPTNNYSMFFVKEKCPDEPCANLEDAEAEAEAAASAVAVAAISNDETVGSGIGASSDTRSFTSADGTAVASGGVATSQETTGQAANEESLAVALPADLSVDTPLSVWPALPSPQTSQQILSQFPGAQPSHFPSFEMNRMLDGHTFAYGSGDESAGSQGQSQKAAALGSDQPGAWPQYQSGVDSFYHPSAGFTGPFISPGGIPGVQCSPHMIFYNHFAPVGQFGQVGLGFMGATYISAGKQPEWKQNHGDLSKLNVVSGQGTSASMPVQNLGPGSPLMAVTPPLTMFDMSPFQPASNIPLQAWSHVPPPLHSIPLSMPPQQHPMESRTPSQFGWSLPGDTSAGNHRLGEPRSSVSAEISRNIPFPNSTASEILDELDLAKQPPSSTASAQAFKPSESIASGNEKKVPKTVVRTVGSSGNGSGCIGASNSNGSGQMSKTQQPNSSGQQHLHLVGNADQQYGISQRTGSGGEWHRRTGFQVRKQGSGTDKNAGPPKMKQIYVAKPSTNLLPNQGQTWA